MVIFWFVLNGRRYYFAWSTCYLRHFDFKLSKFNLVSYLWMWARLKFYHILRYSDMWSFSCLDDTLYVALYFLGSIIVMIQCCCSFLLGKNDSSWLFYYNLDLFLKWENCCTNAFICWSLVMLMRISSKCMHFRIYALIKMLVFNLLYFLWML